MLLCEPFRSGVTRKPCCFFPRHPLASPVEIEVFGKAVLTDLHLAALAFLSSGACQLYGVWPFWSSRCRCHADDEDRSVIAVADPDEFAVTGDDSLETGTSGLMLFGQKPQAEIGDLQQVVQIVEVRTALVFMDDNDAGRKRGSRLRNPTGVLVAVHLHEGIALSDGMAVMTVMVGPDVFGPQAAVAIGKLVKKRHWRPSFNRMATVKSLVRRHCLSSAELFVRIVASLRK